MKLGEAGRLAVSLIEQHLVPRMGHAHGWTFKWNKRKRAYGLCSYRTKTIQLSAVLTAHAHEEQVRDTILHEIAHAIAGPQAKHGPEWQRVAIQLGTKPKATENYNEDQLKRVAQKPKWVMVTSDNRVIKGYHRRPNDNTFATIQFRYLKGKPETKGTLRIYPYNPKVHWYK